MFIYSAMYDDQLWDALRECIIAWDKYGDPNARIRGIAIRLELEGRGYTIRD